ncbi:hypothetical protein K1719_029022 [Acacia pycnantha]|nr:hypothetical protein K1719_029022 [Acacia pycnantha]
MAASYAIQPLLASPVTRISNRSRVNQQLCFPATCMPTPRRNVSLKVRSMAEPDKKQASTKFSDVLAFSGPAPERINGRLAMIGFVAAMAVEGRIWVQATASRGQRIAFLSVATFNRGRLLLHCSVSNYGGYTTHSDPSTAGAGPIITNRASELGRAAGYAQEPYASSSSRHAASRSNTFNDL